MAIAWIATGDLEVVGAYWSSCRQEMGEHPPVVNYPYLLDLLSRGTPIFDVLGARQKLWRALREGKLFATGVDMTTDKRVEISAPEFQDLEFYLVRENEEDILYNKAAQPLWHPVRHPFGVVYRAPSLCRDDVMGLWHKKGDNGQSSRKPRRPGRPLRYDYKVIEAEMERLMEEHGEFSKDDPDWYGLGNLVTAVQVFCEKTFGSRPAPNTVKRIFQRWEPTRRHGP
jgi:hypothetical protein